jgi:uncharacterized phage protein (TIGR02216 family)
LNAAAEAGAGFPWDQVMAAGFGLLRLSPAAFWTMTPREMERALSVLASAGADAPRKGDLAVLMRAFPDEENHLG